MPRPGGFHVQIGRYARRDHPAADASPDRPDRSRRRSRRRAAQRLRHRRIPRRHQLRRADRRGRRHLRRQPVRRGRQRPLEVVIFKGGLGDSYATDVHEPLYKKTFPQAEIKHVATQQIAQTLQPRFASGDVPDMIANSGTDLIDNAALQQEGQLLELTELWDAPPSTTRPRRCATWSRRAPSSRASSRASRT
nr:hypothetical protein GCM10020093_053000 [Planobispora longispora]